MLEKSKPQHSKYRLMVIRAFFHFGAKFMAWKINYSTGIKAGKMKGAEIDKDRKKTPWLEIKKKKKIEIDVI